MIERAPSQHYRTVYCPDHDKLWATNVPQTIPFFGDAKDYAYAFLPGSKSSPASRQENPTWGDKNVRRKYITRESFIIFIYDPRVAIEWVRRIIT